MHSTYIFKAISRIFSWSIVKYFKSRICFWDSVTVYRVSVDNGYPDTTKTTQTLSENFEGFSKTLKEQSGKKVTRSHLHTQ